MKSIAAAIGLLLTLSLGSASGAEVPITDPVRDFLGSFDVKGNKTVVSARPDLNGDGTPDVLITVNDFSNGRQGNIWICYESTADGSFRRIDELAEGVPIEFHQKAVSFRPRRDGKGVELVRYSPGGAGEGFLTAIRLGGGTAAETVIDDFRPREDQSRYTALFESPKTQLVFQSEDSNLLLARYFPFGRWFLSMTPMKWAIAVLGGLTGLVIILALIRVVLGMRRGPSVPR
jgi:hypothetical protein